MNKKQPDEEDLLIRSWKKDASKFVEECLGINPVNGYKLSTQQRDGLRALSELARCKQVVAYHRKGLLKRTPTEEEYEMAKKSGISIMSGKGCHVKGSKVMKSTGHVINVEDVKIGDKLMGPDSKPRTVCNLSYGKDVLYEIQYNDGHSEKVNSQHILSLMCTGSKGKDVAGNTVDVVLKDYLKWGDNKKMRHALFRVGVDNFESSDLDRPEFYDPYIFGCWLGDGDKNGSRFYNIDPEVINAIKGYASHHGFKYRNRIEKEHILTWMESRNNPFVDMLIALDVHKNKHIPHKLLTSSRGERLAILAGLIDTDGSLDQRNKRTFEITQKLKPLADNIQFLARSLGLRCSMREKYIKGYGIYYRMIIGGNTEIIPCKINRKKAIKGNPKTLTVGFKVKELLLGEYYGFSLVEPDGRFLMGDFTVFHNTGKDAFASWAILWMLCCWDGPKIMCTAPTQDQLKQVLWSEIAVWHGRRNQNGQSMFLLKDSIAVEGQKVYMKGVAEPGSTEKDGSYWSAFYRTPQRNVDKSQMAKTLSGQHADNMMFVLDEASGIDDAVFEDLENTMSGAVNFALLIFNPHKPAGFAYETHYGKHKDQWVRLHWDAEESENVSKDNILRLEEKYGRDSDNFSVNVKGLPPKGGDDSLIPYQMVFEAYNREVIPPKDADIVVGIDIARGGKDYTLVTVRQGGKVFPQHRISSVDTFIQLDEIEDILRNQYEDYNISKICVDATGVGASFYDVISRRFPGICRPIRVAESPRDKTRFRRLRDELWWALRERFMNGTIEIPSTPDLLEELHCIQYDQSTGKVIIDNKDKIKKKIGRSCDYADSLMLTMAEKDENLIPIGEGVNDRRRRYGRRVDLTTPHIINGWLYA